MSSSPPPPHSPSRKRATGYLVVLAKVLASLVLFLLCTSGVGDFCFPVLRSGDASRGFQVDVVAAHVLAGVVFVEGMRALWGRALARVLCAVGFGWFLLVLAMVHADFVDPSVRGVFDAIFGLLALYYLVRFVTLRPRPPATPLPEATAP